MSNKYVFLWIPLTKLYLYGMVTFFLPRPPRSPLLLDSSPPLSGRFKLDAICSLSGVRSLVFLSRLQVGIPIVSGWKYTSTFSGNTSEDSLKVVVRVKSSSSFGIRLLEWEKYYFKFVERVKEAARKYDNRIMLKWYKKGIKNNYSHW